MLTRQDIREMYGPQSPQSPRKEMPMSLQSNPVVALAIADVHAWHRAPTARSSEPSWWDAMERQFSQLRKIQKEHTLGADPIPVLIAGDLLDRWNAPAETINFLLACLPDNIFAVPGNHDLPYHSMTELRRSAFFTLVKAGKVKMLHAGQPITVSDGLPVPIVLRGFAHEVDLVPNPSPSAMVLDIAVVHQYLWSDDTGGYPGADEEQNVKQFRKRAKGYNIVIVGDNHTPFDYSFNWKSGAKTTICNCGGFFRRRFDEQLHKPSVVLIRADGSTERKYLDVSKDKWIDAERVFNREIADGIDAVSFIEELSNMADSTINFREAIKEAMDRVEMGDAAKQIVLKAMEESK